MLQAVSDSSDEDSNFDANATDEEIDEGLAFNDDDEAQYGEWFDSHDAQYAESSEEEAGDDDDDDDDDAVIAAHYAAAAAATAGRQQDATVHHGGGMGDDSDTELAAQQWLEGPDEEDASGMYPVAVVCSETKHALCGVP